MRILVVEDEVKIANSLERGLKAEGYIVDVSDGKYEKDEANHSLLYYPSDKDIPHFIVVKPTVVREGGSEEKNQYWLIFFIVVATAWLLARLRGASRK